MTKIKALWNDCLPAFPEAEIAAVRQAVPDRFAQVCCCFRLYRVLHRVEDPQAILLGDYAFGRFSEHLAQLDSVVLTDAFAAYLKQDSQEEQGLEHFLSFIAGIPELIKNEYQ